MIGLKWLNGIKRIQRIQRIQRLQGLQGLQGLHRFMSKLQCFSASGDGVFQGV